MASSSVSQESLDINEDFELAARRSRIRTLRAKGVLHKQGDNDSETSGDQGWDLNGGDGTSPPQSSVSHGGETIMHGSPPRSAIQRAKDKRTRPNHLQKGKSAKDKRKLREKRRSTGVVHLPSTESTGDSLDDDEEDEKGLTEAKRNTTYNEVIDDDNPQTPSEVMRRIQQLETMTLACNTVPKSSQEKTSTVKLMAPKGFVARRNKSPSDLEADLEDNQDYDSGVSQSDASFPFTDQSSASRENATNQRKPTVWSSQSKGSSYSSSVYKPFSSNSDNQVGSTNVSSISNQFAAGKTRQSSFDNDRPPVFQPSQPKSPRSPRSPKTGSSLNPEPVRPVQSVLSRYQERGKPEETSVYKSRFEAPRGFIGQHYVASLINKDTKDDAATRKLERELERERDENRRLQQVLEDKDRRIADLEKQVAMLNRDVEDLVEDREKVEIENRALIQAVQQLSAGAHV